MELGRERCSRRARDGQGRHEASRIKACVRGQQRRHQPRPAPTRGPRISVSVSDRLDRHNQGRFPALRRQHSVSSSTSLTSHMTSPILEGNAGRKGMCWYPVAESRWLGREHASACAGRVESAEGLCVHRHARQIGTWTRPQTH
eukprot:1249888-Rhodomonas_salina.2